MAPWSAYAIKLILLVDFVLIFLFGSRRLVQYPEDQLQGKLGSLTGRVVRINQLPSSSSSSSSSAASATLDGPLLNRHEAANTDFPPAGTVATTGSSHSSPNPTADTIGSLRSVQKDSSVSTIQDAVNPVPKSNVNGRFSTWELLPREKLGEYFNAQELQGLENTSCGHFEQLPEKWKFMGTTLNEIQPTSQNDYRSGPCCPNGHAYGYHGLPLLNTEPLRMAEVTHDGHMVEPFQIKRFLAALGKGKPGLGTPQLSVWILGDSTSSQLFYGFICAMARIGSIVDECVLTRRQNDHYRHPLCNKTGVDYQDSLDNTTTANVTHQFAKFNYMYDDGTTSSNGLSFQVHHFLEQSFCYRLVEPTPFCRAHDARFLNLARSLDPPDILLINTGLHMGLDHVSPRTEQLLQLLVPEYAPKLVWRETTVTHFPDKHQTGVYESYIPQLNRNITSETACADIPNPDAQSRITSAQNTLDKFANETGLRIPILSMKDAETHLYQTYPRKIPDGHPEGKHGDCVHHVYTPLYFDSMFWRMAKLVDEMRLEKTRI